MEKLLRWFAPERLLRYHFILSPFGIAFVTWRITVCQSGDSEFDKLAAYASIGAVIYGMIAVTFDVGGLIVFYTIGSIIKFVGEKKANQDAKALQRVVSNPALLRKASEAAREKEPETVGAK